MKGLHITALTILLCVAAACNKAKIHLSDDKVNVALGDCKQKVISGKMLTICFDSVVSDLRCPPGHMCIGVTGPAIARIKIDVDGVQHYTREISSSGEGSVPDEFVLPEGYRFKFVDLLPYTDYSGYVIGAPPPVIPTPPGTKLRLQITKD